MEQVTTREILDLINKRIQEDEAGAYAEYAEQLLVADDRKVPFLRWQVERFDINARYHLFLVVGYAGVSTFYERYLQGLKDFILEESEKIINGLTPSIGQQFREKLTIALTGRVHHWKAEALKRARENEKEMQDEVASQPRKRPVLVSSAQPTSVLAVKSVLIEQRKKLLEEYKMATGNPSNKRIFEARNSGIHKPEFYSWLKGELPPESATSIAFERFLQLKKPPIPRNPKP